MFFVSASSTISIFENNEQSFHQQRIRRKIHLIKSTRVRVDYLVVKTYKQNNKIYLIHHLASDFSIIFLIFRLQVDEITLTTDSTKHEYMGQVLGNRLYL